MNRKIYLLIYGVHHEESSIVGIYTDLNEAKRSFLTHVKDVDDVKISENGMSADNGCCYYMIDEREFKDNIKIEKLESQKAKR